MKILHLGNIAENGYLNAKFQRENGIEADVLIYDYHHVAGQPEWEDADFDETINELNPDWSKVNLRGFKRPEWFREINHGESKVLNESNARMGPVVKNTLKRRLVRLALKPKNLPKTITYIVKNTARKYKIEREYSQIIDRKDLLPPSPYIEQYVKKDDSFIRKYLKNLSYFTGVYWLAQEFKSIFSQYDIIQAYGIDPILVYLSGVEKPLVSFEHGTMRSFPLEDFIIGKLLTIAYHKSKKCIITNPDVISTAKKIKLTNYTFVPHPLDTDKFKPRPGELRREIYDRYRCDIIFFAPARHNFELKGNDKIIHAYAEFVKNYAGKPLLILSDWGQEQEKSRAIIRGYGIEKFVMWTAMLPKRKLANYYNASDVVLDQFAPHIGVFGSTTPEAMACGKPVLMNYSEAKARWAFPENPPIVSVETSKEIYTAMMNLGCNHAERTAIGNAGRQWIEKYHSKKIVVDRFTKIYEEILN